MSKKYLKQQRKFSVSLKQRIVSLIETGQINVASAAREYGVSDTAIYNWIHAYSSYNKKGVVMTIDKQSQSHQIQQLKQRIAQLEQAVGQKQMLVDYYQKYSELLSEQVCDEVKKKLDTPVAIGLPSTKNSTGGK